MKQSALSEAQESLLNAEGDKLREMMRSEGWAVMSRLFKSTVEMYDSTRGLKTLKEMLARQDALAMMNAWMEAVVQRVARLEHKEAVSKEVRNRMAVSGLVRIEADGKDE